jgi:hypothetical protein
MKTSFYGRDFDSKRKAQEPESSFSPIFGGYWQWVRTRVPSVNTKIVGKWMFIPQNPN